MKFNKRLQYLIGLLKYCQFRAKNDFITWVAFTPRRQIFLHITGLTVNFLVVWYLFLK